MGHRRSLLAAILFELPGRKPAENNEATIVSSLDCSGSGRPYVDISQDDNALLHDMRLSARAHVHGLFIALQFGKSIYFPDLRPAQDTSKITHQL